MNIEAGKADEKMKRRKDKILNNDNLQQCTSLPEINVRTKSGSGYQFLAQDGLKTVPCSSAFENALQMSAVEYTVVPQDYWDDLFEIAITTMDNIENAD
jgi:hypothetical protein